MTPPTLLARLASFIYSRACSPPILTPLAAVGLSLTMLGAAKTHLRRGESQMIVINAVLLLLAVFVVYGRFLAVPFS